MSERSAALDRPTGLGWLVLGGTAALLLRARLLTIPVDQRVWLLAAIYGAVAIASGVAPIRPARAVLARWVVLAIGLSGVAAASVAAGPVIRAPMGPWSIPLALLAAVAEELLFRRAVYGWLERRGAGPAVAGSALAFAAIHVPLYGVTALPVDMGAGLLLSWQRWAAGTWTVPAATHGAANLLAVLLR
jgi:hypothetical protein